MDEIDQDTSGFTPFFFFAQACGGISVCLVAIWMGVYRNGFAWQSNPSLEFNWHPLLMVFSLIYMYGNGILVYRFSHLLICRDPRRSSQGMLIYRVFRHEKKKKLKILHGSIMIIAFFTAVLGLKTVFDSHNLATNPIPNAYSLHSWLGLTSITLFAFQWIAGFVTFFFPGLASHLRLSYLPIHVLFGTLIFALACVTALLGITEKAIFALKENYQLQVSEGILANSLGIMILLFCFSVLFLVGTNRYKRIPIPEDERLLTEDTFN